MQAQLLCQSEQFSGPHHIQAFYHPSLALSLTPPSTSSTGGGRPPGIRGQGSKRAAGLFIVILPGTKEEVFVCLCVYVREGKIYFKNSKLLCVYIFVSINTMIYRSGFNIKVNIE